MSTVVSRIAAFARRVAIWFVAVLPISPSVWGLCMGARHCFTTERLELASCLTLSAVVAPLALIFGPLAGTVDEPINRWPDVLATALLLALLITTLP